MKSTLMRRGYKVSGLFEPIVGVAGETAVTYDNVLDALVDRTVERNWKPQRYCFACKVVKTFLFCDNCEHFFCPEHMELLKEYGEFGSLLSAYYDHGC